jgi:protein-ribulosamine 3-kinase
MIPTPVDKWLQEKGLGKVVYTRSVGGGCINNGSVLETSSGKKFFLKTNPSAPEDMFEKEAEGLAALRETHEIKVPEPFFWSSSFLLLEDLSPASRKRDYWEEFGRKLAALHLHTNSHFGFHHDNYIGSTSQTNRYEQDGWKFFKEQRLIFQANLAERQGLLGKQDAASVNRLAEGLHRLVPEQPASLLHGDLWSGNALTDYQGSPALIDPAAHYGWAEAELAMTALFGAFPETFYNAYNEARPLEKGYRERFPIYNLYHLLNHLNLFGRGYLAQVRQILDRYG